MIEINTDRLRDEFRQVIKRRLEAKRNYKKSMQAKDITAEVNNLNKTKEITDGR